jgi:hypothetical protein
MQQTRTSGLSAVVYPVIPCNRLRPPPVPFRPITASPLQPVVSSSVRRYLGSLNKTRKHKMHLPSHYFHISELTYNI